MRAEVREQHRAHRPGDEAREIEHADAVEAGVAPGGGPTKRRGRAVRDRRGRRRLERLADEPGGEHLRIAKILRAILHGAARDVGGAEGRDPIGGRPPGEDRLELAAHEGAKCGRPEAQGIPLQALVDQEIDTIEERHELHPERLRERAQEDPAVGGGIEAVARIDAARIAADEERALMRRTGDVGPAVEREGRLEPARVQALSRKPAESCEVRGRDAERREHAGHVGDDRRHEPYGTTRPRPLERVHAGRGLHQRLVGWEREARSGASPRGDAARDRGLAGGLGLVGDDGVGGRRPLDRLPTIEDWKCARRMAGDSRAEPGEQAAGEGPGEPARVLAHAKSPERTLVLTHARKRSLYDARRQSPSAMPNSASSR
jgi:hypothetical protein